ncbi:hypothetical protein [Sorangium sp. So ce426]|uniref:hypothetical protein n=1 Tax=unclassified Sorangium TaxID=2621164 RepID=UPI003F5B2ABC
MFNFEHYLLGGLLEDDPAAAAPREDPVHLVDHVAEIGDRAENPLRVTPPASQ